MISMYPMSTNAQASPRKARSGQGTRPGTANGAAGKPMAATATRAPTRRIQVRRSGVHGKGVYAARPIVAGETIIEYTGEVISWTEALRRHPHDPLQPEHTFYFHLDDSHVIDGTHNGNAAKWINHACEPNCEAEERDGRVYIHALRDLAPGEELFYDYRLVLDGRHTPKVKKQYACLCGAPGCRGTMLAPKR
jgi:SET domain-containing protein